jgi:hypothetical protein
MAQQDEEVRPADLSRFDREWVKTAVSNEPYGDIPDGTYDAVIEEARVTRTATTGKSAVVWSLRIQGPAAVNRRIVKTRVITANTLEYLREDLEKCQLSVSRVSELPERLKELVGREIGIDKRTKDGWVNVYFRWDSERNAKAPELEDLPF